jgi:excisionase family DNA binding protein
MSKQLSINFNMPSQLLKPGDVAKILSVSNTRVYDLIRKGLLPCVHIGRQIRINPTTLEEFIQTGGKVLDNGWKK